MWRRIRLPGLVFLLAFALYLRTLAPDVYVSDFAEFQYLPARLGLAHPNGFPFYMLVGWLWSHLPFGTLAWRMNLLSALSGALAVSLTAGFAQRLTRRSSVAVLAAGLLALSPTFWSFSLVAERYTLNLALLVGALWTAWEAAEAECRSGGSETGRSQTHPYIWPAYLSAALVSLGLATHPTNALLAPFWLGYLIWRLPQHRRSGGFWLRIALAAGLPLLLYLYVPWRWAVLSSWPAAPGIGGSSAVYQGLAHVWYQPALDWRLLGKYVVGLGGYAGGLVEGGWRDALSRLSGLLGLWRTEIPWPLWPLAALGLLRLARRDAALALATVGFSAALTVVVAYIQQGKNDAYLLPAFWTVMFGAAMALDLVAGRSQKSGVRGQESGVRSHGSGVLLALVLVALVVLAWQRYPARDLSRSSDTGQWWRATLSLPIETGAGLLAQWSDLTPFWYMQQAEGRRTDLLGLFPPDPAAIIEPWLSTGRPLYLAGPLHGWAPDLAQRYNLMPWGNLVRILRSGEVASCPGPSTPVESPDAWPIRLAGWQVDGPLTGGGGSGGAAAAAAAGGLLRFCWTSQTELPRQTFLAIELRSAGNLPPIRLNEPLLIQWYPQETIPAGTVGLAAIPLRLPLGAPAGTYDLRIVPYRLADDGSAASWPDTESLALGQVSVQPSRTFERALLTDETVPIVAPRSLRALEGGPLALRAWRLSQEPVRPGDPIRLDLLWEVREPHSAPLSLSLIFWDLSGRARAGPILSSHSAGTTSILGESSAAADLTVGTIVRTSVVVSAPRGRGDRTYVVELRLKEGDSWLGWFPTGPTGYAVALPIGTIRVLDRPHLDTLPGEAVPADAVFGDTARLAGYVVDRQGRAADRGRDAVAQPLLARAGRDRPVAESLRPCSGCSGPDRGAAR